MDQSQPPLRLSYATSISPTLVSRNRSSGVSTLCEKDIFHIDSESSKSSNTKKEYKLTSSRSPCPNPPKFPPVFLKKLFHFLDITVLISDYRAKRRLRTISSRLERWKWSYHPTTIKELETIYEYLYKLKHSKPKFAFAAFMLRLSILELWLDFANLPVLFSEHRKQFLIKLWADLAHESCDSYDINGETQWQIVELKQRVFSRILDELPLNCPIHEIVPDGHLFVETLCEELAYGSGVYAVQRALKQIARTEWGHEELLRLSTDRSHDNKESGRLIMDCIMRLLRFDNGFSCAMAFHIFGRLAASTPEVYNLLEGPMGVGWLAENLRQLSVSYSTEGRPRVIEMYCRALAIACARGFVESVIGSGITSTLLQLIQHFNERDERMRGKIEDDLEDDLDVERDQIACCGLVVVVMKNPLGKKEFLAIPESELTLTTFMNNSNRAFSDWKLLDNIACIRWLYSNQQGTPVKNRLAWNYL